MSYLNKRYKYKISKIIMNRAFIEKKQVHFFTTLKMILNKAKTIILVNKKIMMI